MADTRTLGNMINRITREIRRDGLTADIRDSIVSAIRSVESRRFWFNEGEATATATAGALKVSLPVSFIQVDEVWYEDTSSARFTLRPIHYTDLVQEDIINSNKPSRYSIYADEMQIRPPIDSQYVFRINGLFQFTELSASASSGASNAWTTEAEELIRPLAKGYLFAGRLRNSQRAREEFQMADLALNRLLDRTVQQISTHRIRKTHF